ncbi:MAG: cache domain-containing protein [Deltaproteobacteria bacterium]|nr:cache domain-containing protein [Deltaproteobacteria bacterium]
MAVLIFEIHPFKVCVVAAALFLASCRDSQERTSQSPALSNEVAAIRTEIGRHRSLSADIRAAVTKQGAELDKLLSNPQIESFVKAASANQRAPNSTETAALDAAWAQAGAGDPLVRKVSDNPCSTQLLAFQKEHPVFAEIFITDSNGFNICQTNKTSDYFQADEGWWKEGYSDGKGAIGFGSIELDKSAGIEAIPIHLPIYDSNSHVAIGVAKGVLNLTRIIAEL